MIEAYSDERLYEIAAENYQTLVFHCSILKAEGYWTKPELVLQQTIEETLDLQIQSLLLIYACRHSQYGEREHRFLLDIVMNNALQLPKDYQDTTEEIIGNAEKVLKMPPILLQLFGLRDKHMGSKTAEICFDMMLNILMSMAYLSHRESGHLVEFIHNYYESIRVFVDDFAGGYEAIEEAQLLEKMKRTKKVSAMCVSTENPIEASLKRAKQYGKKHDVEEEKKTAVNVIEKAQVQEEIGKAKAAWKAAKLEKLLGELNRLVGLTAVKNEVSSLVNLIRVRKMREKHNMPVSPMSYHMVFTGNPGTGKTTVARIIASIYKELGIVSKGTFVETDRSGLVAGYIGQTALKVKEVVDSAIGGVLFIDEAYALTSRNRTDDYGFEAVDTLVKLMEDNREDLVVIVAGYREEMQEFLQSNTGLISRFNKFIDFQDYTNEELVQILLTMFETTCMCLEEAATAQIKQDLQALSKERRASFGNARGIRNVYEKIIVNQANRIVQIQAPSSKDLALIVLADVQQVIEP